MKTPTTDAAFNAANLHTHKRYKKIYETCQKLETERNQAIAERDELLKLIKAFAGYHCNDQFCECHNCKAHRFTQKLKEPKTTNVEKTT
jgi:hypothetical protein